MKKIFKLKNYLLPAILLVIGLVSCKKEKAGGVNGTPGGSGPPTIASIHTIEKGVVDSMLKVITYTYDNSGVRDSTFYYNTNPQVTKFDSATVTGNLGNYYVLMGTNLGSTTNISINGISIYFNRALNSDNTVIFNIPSTIPYVQPQSNTIVVKTLHGSVTYKFTTLPPPPTIYFTSDYDFWSNSQITMTGKGFAAVSAMKLRTTGDPITILSKNDSTLVVQMPATSTVTESSILFTYTSGANPNSQTASTAIFNDLDNAYTLFFQNNFQNSWYGNAWAAVGVSTAASHGGTASYQANYPAGAWAIDGFGNNNGIAYSPDYKYFSFWVKGGVVDHHLVIVGDQMQGGFSQVQWDSNPPQATAAQIVLVPAKVWTFVKVPLGASQTASTPSTLQPWLNGTPTKNLGLFLKGEGGDVNETMYFDEVAFIK